ncbi:MAG: DoxX family membrane protein [Rubrobacter sp.]|nr:DoxX family membrane protein [Rubrobacter sp.]
MSGMAWIRILLGAVWLNGAVEKILNPAFPAQFERALLSGSFIAQAPPFLQSFMRQTVLPNAEAFAQLVRFGELAVGLALVFGLLVNPAALVSVVYSAALFLAQGGPNLGEGLSAPEFLTINLMLALISASVLLSPSSKDSSLDTGLARSRPRLAPLLLNRRPRRPQAGSRGRTEGSRSVR